MVAIPLTVSVCVALFAHGLGGPVSAKPVAQESRPAPLQRIAAPVPADDGASAELFVRLQPGDTLEKLLTRAGVAAKDAATTNRLVEGALPAGLAGGTEVAVLLGESSLLQRVTLRAGLELKLILTRDGSGALRLAREDISVDSSPLRFRGPVGGSLYWSLRARGVHADAASEYLSLLSGRIDIGRELAPGDQFDLVIANRRASTGETQTGPLLYAAVDRRGGADLRLVSWPVGGRSGWFDATSGTGHSTGLIWPVPGRVTSAFGARVHPILRFVRFHRGVDIGASWGTPIVAAADGRVVGSGWNGGHGRQVRIAHRGGLETSYSHMSQIAAHAGALVRQGQLIGYVGSTGFSTGPHLHYEVHDRGGPVDPSSARHSGTRAVAGAELAAIRARLRQLLALRPNRSALPA